MIRLTHYYDLCCYCSEQMESDEMTEFMSQLVESHTLGLNEIAM